MSNVGAQRESDNTIVKVPLCQDGAGTYIPSSMLTGSVEFRVENLHGADNRLRYSVCVLDTVGAYNV